MKYYIAVFLSILLLDGILFVAIYGAWTEEYNAEPSETEKQAIAYYSPHLPTPTEDLREHKKPPPISDGDSFLRCKQIGAHCITTENIAKKKEDVNHTKQTKNNRAGYHPCTYNYITVLSKCQAFLFAFLHFVHKRDSPK